MADNFKTKGDLYALAGILGIGGALILLTQLGKGESGEPLVNGGTMSNPHSSLDNSPVLRVSISSWANGQVGNIVKASLPWVEYDGPGQNTYTYLRVVQNSITVMGSGVAGVWVGNKSDNTYQPPNVWGLVAPDQPQPNPNQSCPNWGQQNVGQWLEAWMHPWPVLHCEQRENYPHASMRGMAGAWFRGRVARGIPTQVQRGCRWLLGPDLQRPKVGQAYQIP